MTAEPDGTMERITTAIAAQPQETVTVLSSLLAVHDELGYLSAEAIEVVARHTGSTINDVWGVASFYTNFRTEPPRPHVIEVCWGASCHVLGAMKVVKAVLGASGLEAEGDTPDGKATVRLNTCLGACSHGPVISVDHHLHGKVRPEGAEEMVTKLLNS